MISLDVLIIQLSGLTQEDLKRWIDNEWVRPDEEDGTYVFRDIDVARVRLIRELRDEMLVNEDALPIVLSLLDQLYDLRRRLRDLRHALLHMPPDEMHRILTCHLMSDDVYYNDNED
ncbi:chaperone modulator CbpM [Pararhodospirillum photometricum]|nr:chaperone modulator CbpM [Pararhodospirillum photometricum]